MKRAWLALVALGGCAVGPDFHTPAPPSANAYTAAPLAPGFAEGADIPGEWWTLFHSKPLDDLIERALRANPDLAAAQAALGVARESALAQRGAYFPSVDANVSVSRSKTSSQISPTPSSGESIFSLYAPELTVSYAPDVFGLTRRTVEAADAQVEEQRFAWVAADLTLTSNVALGAIQEAQLRAQIDATHELVAINTDMLRALEHQFVKGYVGRLDVAAQQSQLAQVQATLPPLLKRLAQQRDLLTALSGGFPNDPLPEQFELALLGRYVRGRRQFEPDFDPTSFIKIYVTLAAQRASKILGIFARLDLRDGKPQYLRHMPRVWGYLQRSLSHPALEALNAWYIAHVPALNAV